MLWPCFKLPSCPFGNIRDTSFLNEKANLFVLLICNRKNVRINMKQVSYSSRLKVIGMDFKKSHVQDIKLLKRNQYLNIC